MPYVNPKYPETFVKPSRVRRWKHSSKFRFCESEPYRRRGDFDGRSVKSSVTRQKWPMLSKPKRNLIPEIDKWN